MRTIMVTGATGLLGSRVCTMLLEQGDRPRALARNPDARDARALAAAGVEIVKGDIADNDSVVAATRGADGVVHSAAMLGRPLSTYEVGFQVNVVGTMNVLTAACLEGNIPVVHVLTSTFFDMWEETLTERSPLDAAFRNRDPYSVTKRLGYVEAYVRAAQGQEIRFMIPGAIYGPSICADNAMIQPSYNQRIASAIRGELDPLIANPVPFSYVDDCAYVCVAALDKGRRGELYIAHGREEDVASTATSCSRACEIAGVPYRVADVPRDELDRSDALEKYGATLCTLGKQTYPEPFSTSYLTQERLGYVPTPIDQGLAATVAWMREQGFIPA